MRKMVAEPNQVISQFEQNVKGHPYSDAYVNQSGNFNRHELHHVNGNDNEITMTVVSNGVSGVQNRAFRDGRRRCFWYEKEIENNLCWCFALNR